MEANLLESNTHLDALMLALNEMKPELTSLLNRCGVNTAMDAPGYLLSEFIMEILMSQDRFLRLRNAWLSPTSNLAPKPYGKVLDPKTEEQA